MAGDGLLTMIVLYIIHIIILSDSRRTERPPLPFSGSSKSCAACAIPSSGCEWDTVQTFETIAPYTIEEAYEVADAIARNDMDALADELGDLQLQVVFHARMAEEAGLFTLDDVLDRSATRWSAATRTSSATPSMAAIISGRSSRPRNAPQIPTKARLPALPWRFRRSNGPRSCSAAPRGRLRLARRFRPARQDRRGTGRARRRDRARTQARGARRPAVRRRQPRTASQRRA